MQFCSVILHYCSTMQYCTYPYNDRILQYYTYPYNDRILHYYSYHLCNINVAEMILLVYSVSVATPHFMPTEILNK